MHNYALIFLKYANAAKLGMKSFYSSEMVFNFLNLYLQLCKIFQIKMQAKLMSYC